MAGDIVVMPSDDIRFSHIKAGKHYILLKRASSGSAWQLVGLPGGGHCYDVGAFHNLTVEAEKLARLSSM